jgi:hypothetical protein
MAAALLMPLLFCFYSMHSRYEIPACVGMTLKKAGMTLKKAGMTLKKAGMTLKKAGMTLKKAGMTKGSRNDGGVGLRS